MGGLLEYLGLTKKPEASPSPQTGPNDWDEDGERKRVRDELATLQSDDLRDAGATVEELKQLQDQIEAVEESLEDYIYMMPEAELDELKKLRELVRKQIDLRNKSKPTESPPSSNPEPKPEPKSESSPEPKVEPTKPPVQEKVAPVITEEMRLAKVKYETRLKDFMTGYNDIHGRANPTQQQRLATTLKQATDLAEGDSPKYAQAEKNLDDAQLIVNVTNTYVAAKPVYEQALLKFKTEKYDPVFNVASEEQKQRLSKELGKVTTAASAPDPDYAQVESMLLLVEPVIERVEEEIETARKEVEAAEQEKQRLIEEAKQKKENDKQANKTQLADMIDELDRFVKLTATPLPKYSEKLRKLHTAAVKMQTEDNVTDDSDPIDELDVGADPRYFLDMLAEYQDRYTAVLTANPNGPVQAELKKLYNEAMVLAGKGEFDDAVTKFDHQFEAKLQGAEGEPLYTKVFEEAEKEYDRIDGDVDATMPEEAMADAYTEAQRLADEDGKYGAAIKLLRGILLLVPKVDAYTNKYKLVKPAYNDSQASGAITAQKNAITAVLTEAQQLVKDGDPSSGMKKLDDLTIKIKEVETATERRTKASKFPSVVPKGGDKGMEKLGDAKALLKDGGMKAEDVMKMIPKGKLDSWHGSKTRFAKGFQYEWEGPPPEKVKYHVHGHTKDANHSTGNSGTGAVVRIRVGDDWLKADGTLTSSLYDDEAHIPMF